MSGCTARIFVFSGRPDPTWTIEDTIAEELERIWDSLPPMHREPPVARPLGYRGCLLKCKNDIEWFVYRNQVVLTRNGKTESRNDDQREFERLVISSAPQGLIPPSLVKIDDGGGG